MKEQNKIPVSKVARAMKFVKTGAKVGGNYMKYYGKKAFNPDYSRDHLHEDNAEDVYASLSELKGSALKVAQMLSMDQNMLPTAYQQKFMMAQYSAPPLSYPLVVKTFKQTLGKSPSEMFDQFSKNAIRAASIGQVHLAEKEGKKLAVKVQYPGVAESVKSDLKLVRPFAVRVMDIQDQDLDMYFDEVEEKLLEETDYTLELNRSMEITKACAALEGIHFPQYYPEWSSQRIITMDWLEGDHLKEYLSQHAPDQDTRNLIGQRLWDFYDFQMHSLKKVHADPHPGNFLINEKGEIGVIDFGCIKEVPEDFYRDYFGLLYSNEKDDEVLLESFKRLQFILPSDTPKEQQFFLQLFKELIGLMALPFHSEIFDFGDDVYFTQIFNLGDKIRKMDEVREAGAARGSRHGLYVNRTYFGLYNLLNMLKAKVKPRVGFG